MSTIYFYNGVPLIRGGLVAMDQACCCIEECCCGPCIKFRFTIAGLGDKGNCPGCVGANGTYITGEINPIIVNNVCIYAATIIPDPNPLAGCEDVSFELEAKVTCPVNGGIRVEASVQVGLILVPAPAPGEPALGELPHFILDENVNDCENYNQSLELSGTDSNICDLTNATVTLEILPCNQVLAQPIVAASFVDGDLTAFTSGEGSVSGSSDVSGTLSAFANFEGSSTTTTALTGVLQGNTGLEGQVTSTSSLTGSLEALGNISGEVTGTSSLEGLLTQKISLSGHISGTSSLTSTISAVANISGSVKAASVLTGRVAGDAEISGNITGVSVLSGILGAVSNVSGEVSATSTSEGTLSALGNISTESTTTSTLTGSLTAFGLLSGDVESTTTTSGTLSALANLAGGVNGVSTLTSTLSAIGNIDGEITGVSDTDTTLSAYANLAGEVTGVSVLTGNLESCCCGDCIRFRYTISGLANDSCTTCNDYNTDNDSDNVNPNESCVYSAQWESSDCNGTKLVFNAELICDDDGDIRLTGSVQDTALLEPLIDPPGEGPEPTNDIMSGTDTFTLGTPCNELEITLSRDTGSQTTCDFDSATVVLKVIDCPENQAVIEKIKKKARGKKKRPPKKRTQLPVCQHLGEELGLADCGCGGKPMIYHCNLLNKPCMKNSVSKPVSRVGDKKISRPQVCSLCDHFEPTDNPQSAL
jgi:hypothetical protein